MFIVAPTAYNTVSSHSCKSQTAMGTRGHILHPRNILTRTYRVHLSMSWVFRPHLL